MVAIVAMWALNFSGSDQLVDEQAATTSDPLRASRLAVNTQVVGCASLIAVAVANEMAIEQPTGEGSGALSLLMFGGPFLYLAVQSWYLHELIGEVSRPRLVAMAGLVVAGMLSALVMPIVAAALMCGILLAVVRATRDQPVHAA